MVCLPSKAGGPFLNLIVVFGEYIRVNILIFFISSGGMVVGSSLTPFLHLNRIIDLLCGLPLWFKRGGPSYIYFIIQIK